MRRDEIMKKRVLTARVHTVTVDVGGVPFPKPDVSHSRLRATLPVGLEFRFINLADKSELCGSLHFTVCFAPRACLCYVI